MARSIPRSEIWLVLLSLACGPTVSTAAWASNAPWAPLHTRHLPYRPNEIVVIARDGMLRQGPGGDLRSDDSRLARALVELGMDHGRRVDPNPVARGARRERIWLLSSSRPGFDPVRASHALEATGAVKAACPNYRFGPLTTLPNDPYLANQWYVNDGGFADIHLPLAWDVARGDSTVTIAIMDTGVDTGHPDLASRIWHNPGEIPGNGLDDDGNGFVDDVEGWDFGWGDNDPKPEAIYDPLDPFQIDYGFHGTFCAGIACAETDNAVGIAGAGWGCKIMPLKVSHPDSGLTSSAIAGAFAYAADQHASVISMSFGGPGDPGVPEFFQALVDMATAAGSVCVAAAGNDGDSTRVYPAACDKVLAVAATDDTNQRASFSNWGPWVDVAAPGASMFSTICRNYTISDLDQIWYLYFFGWDGETPYMWGDGTSFACPLTAGVCGLVRARFPYLTPSLVQQQIIATGDTVAYDFPIGVKVNAYQAVTTTPTVVAETRRVSSRIALVGAVPNPVRAAGSEIGFELSEEGWASLALFDASGRLVRTLVEGRLAAGPHSFAWDGHGDRGSPLASGVYFARLTAKGQTVAKKIILLGG